MKSKLVLSTIVLFLAAITAPAMADMQVSTWESPTCEHTMNTNHFTLEPGETAAISLTQSSCLERKGVLFFGYNTKKRSSRLLTSRDNIRLTVVDNTGAELTSDEGRLFMPGEADSCILYAENTSRNKTIKIRLRASVRW